MMRSDVFVRRYARTFRTSQYGDVDLIFTPLVQTGASDTRNVITFTGATRAIAEDKAFNAGFRGAEIEEPHGDEPNRWQERW